ncbi:hypothetical protein D3C73_1341470 [compost metagenome]
MVVVRKDDLGFRRVLEVSDDLIGEGLRDLVPPAIVEDVHPAVQGAFGVDAPVRHPLIGDIVRLDGHSHHGTGLQLIEIEGAVTQ